MTLIRGLVSPSRGLALKFLKFSRQAMFAPHLILVRSTTTLFRIVIMLIYKTGATWRLGVSCQTLYAVLNSSQNNMDLSNITGG